ncbi:CIA30 family protein [Halorhodospira halophila]|uniref:NADH:ubiquinone oxidoreductase complex I intermediate-associated protein 30 n=1 Tax=Halorhodospira halophila (strain DSM 244 / SL1) TaxID=349124 RepID=A1WWI6_HALHL|nr:CIA30 family protein [Halorhodospira halophila]ABM62048.1 NADH:ubiquinone oxidoreductase complex I intermediate-associated protein 30 [Halorhodospira halophila SL1]MBK1728411.1 hypothetical protein [Halorhodospira halophila]
MPGTESPAAYLLDDFASADGRAAIGTAWQGFTDRVMGGRSDMQAGIVETECGPALQLSGQVRLENNGGFIQSRLPLAPTGEAFNASAWSGFGATVRGTPGPYYLHVRSTDTRQPWQHYRAPLPVAEDWQDVVVPFTAFEPRGLRAKLDTARLTSVAVVAYGAAFEARVEIARLGLSATRP